MAFLVIGVLARGLGRRDGDKSPRLNDFAVGTSTLLMTYGKVATDFLTDLADPQVSKDEMANSFWWLLGLLIVIMISILHDRYSSWDKQVSERDPPKKRLLIGVILPDVAAVLIFVAYQIGYNL